MIQHEIPQSVSVPGSSIPEKLATSLLRKAFGRLPTATVQALARRLAEPRFGYLPEGRDFVVSLATGLNRQAPSTAPRV